METIKFGSGTFKDGRKAFWVYSPFHPDFPAAARGLGGKWSAEKSGWYFDARDEDAVRRLVRDLYGFDEYERPDLVQVVLHYPELYGEDLFEVGRQLARRAARDYAVRLGDGVILLGGTFSRSGGSRNHPSLNGRGIVLLVRDVPRALASTLAEAQIFEADATAEQIRGVLAAQELTGTRPVNFARGE